MPTGILSHTDDNDAMIAISQLKITGLAQLSEGDDMEMGLPSISAHLFVVEADDMMVSQNILLPTPILTSMERINALVHPRQLLVLTSNYGIVGNTAGKLTSPVTGFPAQ